MIEGQANCLKALTLLSPSKINLFFQVLHRRSDGYHEIASLYQIISLSDRMEISLSTEDSWSCNDPALLWDPSNLVYKALSLFRKKSGISSCFQISLHKQIPMQAGLGGGSGNAATTLWGVNALLGFPVDEQMLRVWAGEIGSDVPVFFSNGLCYCTGRGEILHPVQEDLRLPPIWIAKPSEGLSTPAVYRAWEPSPKEPKSAFYNDLEIPAFSLMPRLKQYKQDLLDLGFEHVVMTGSGTAFFCLGSLSQPKLEGIRFFLVEPLYRKERSWYEFMPI